MKAPSSDASEDGGAENEEYTEPIDYCDFFSVLMYYGHMSKESILNSSRPFLYGVYSKYTKRACENLGVSPDGTGGEDIEDGQLSEADYPTDFHKITDIDRQQTMNNLTNDTEFMRQFGQYLQ